jgi:hypothetical protein
VVDAIGLGPVVPWAGSRIESGEHTCRYAGVMLAHAYLHQGSLIRYTPHTITVTLDLPAHAPWTLDPGPWTLDPTGLARSHQLLALAARPAPSG